MEVLFKRIPGATVASMVVQRFLRMWWAAERVEVYVTQEERMGDMQ